MANPDDRLALYIQCKEWETLPSSGGIFEQDPEILQGFDIISNEIHKEEMRKQKEADRKAKRR